VPRTQVQTAAVITLTLSALWVLVVLARPFTRLTALVVVGGYAGLIAVLAIPVSRDFLHLGTPSVAVLLVAVGGGAGASLLLELVHRVGRGARTAAGNLTLRREQRARREG
jgi:hypothetical protein